MLSIEDLHFSYKNRQALRGVSFQIAPGEIFGLLGPNGSGKTTLFRILSTALLPASGKVVFSGLSFADQASAIRKKIGVVFQSPSLDGKLTVEENLFHQGHLYGLCGAELKKRAENRLAKLGLLDRRKERTDKLSGGLKRRVELAKALLHDPELLILDEPSTGLDPGARLDLWTYLAQLNREKKVTILVTTHLMEEAEHCGRVAIMDQGKVVALDKPENLKRKIGGDVLEIRAPRQEALAEKIKQRFGLSSVLKEGVVQIEHENAAAFVPQLAGSFPGELEAITIRKPTLEDVFVRETGHRFWNGEEKP